MKYRSSESEEDALSLEQNFTKSSSPEGNLSDQYAHLRTGTFTVEIDEINYIESVL
jgi:hypothetical protein